ncbi:MAG TPA: M43 family zinc metalloprotease [Chitinophagaceae bacterium]
MPDKLFGVGLMNDHLRYFMNSFTIQSIYFNLATAALLLLLLQAAPVSAQRKCGTPEAIKEALAKNPKLVKKLEQFNRLARISARAPNMHRAAGNIVMIPVVVHIVLQNPNSVTDAQVASQIAELNQDYTASNPDTSRVPAIWKPLTGNMQMQFCLAERTPGGDPSDGIIRVKTTQSQFSINNACSTVKHAATGGSDAWDSHQYLNIWVCNLETNYLGVTTPPGLYPDDEQGAVIQYDAFGTIGNLEPLYNKGRTTTHEIGHYFYLYHPWGNGDGSCSPGDYVDDTPPQTNAVYGCPAFPKTDQCSPNYPGIMFMNFMQYVDDSCMYMFSQGQVARAQSSLYSDRATLLSSDGCSPVILQNNDAAIYRVSDPAGKVCDNTIAPVVVLKNKGKDTLRSVTVSYQVDNGAVTAYQWTGSLPSIDTVTLQLPAANINIGNHLIKVYTSLPNNVPDEQPANDTSKNSFHLDPVAAPPFAEGFEDTLFAPAGWEASQPDSADGWQRTITASHSGRSSAVVRNFINSGFGSISDLISPVFNITGADSAFLYFYVAAAVQTNPDNANNNWDTLKVLISKDCGTSAVPLYQRWGKNLITRQAVDAEEFVPGSTEWRKDSIDLTPYINRGNFQLVFRNINNNENDIYIDDISVVTKEINPYLKKEKVLVVPNPASNEVTILFLEVAPDLKAVEIFNSIGQRVAWQPAAAIMNNRLQFNLANLSNGVYFVKILYQNRSLTREIIKLP